MSHVTESPKCPKDAIATIDADAFERAQNDPGAKRFWEAVDKYAGSIQQRGWDHTPVDAILP